MINIQIRLIKYLSADTNNVSNVSTNATEKLTLTDLSNVYKSINNTEWVINDEYEIDIDGNGNIYKGIYIGDNKFIYHKNEVYDLDEYRSYVILNENNSTFVNGKEYLIKTIYNNGDNVYTDYKFCIYNTDVPEYDSTLWNDENSRYGSIIEIDLTKFLIKC